MDIFFFSNLHVINFKKVQIFVLILVSIVLSIPTYGQADIDSVQLYIADGFYQEADTVYDINVNRSIILYDSASIYYKKSRSWEEYVSCLNTLAAVYYY
ncbi:MAG: hypothetical protein ACI9VN_003042, partial [Patescibacteria group bacterium]